MSSAARALPARTDRFVGRGSELRLLAEALRRARLVTVTGPGGVGKTRLALELARGRARRSGEVVLIDLSAIGEEGLVSTGFATSVGVAGAGVNAMQAVVRALEDSSALIVVDNCEHVIHSAAVAVAALLEGCPRLRVLVTSREPLRIQGETVQPLGPLDPEEAMRLFLERAEAARADAVTGDDGAVREICARLEGMPLALELAAARIAVLSPDTLLSRLAGRLDLLSRDARIGLARQHSVRATLEWSFALLSPPERAGFARLAVFAGSFSLAAAERVAGVDLDMLGGLVSKSLVFVLRTPGQELRYRLLETLRTFGREQLRASGEEPGICERHLQFFRSQARAVYGSGALGGAERDVRALCEEIDNLRAALSWANDHDPASGLELIGAGREVFFRRSQSEGLTWARNLLALHPASDRPKALGLLAAGHLAVAHQDHAGALRWLGECADLAERLGDAELCASACHYLGTSAMLCGQAEEAERWLERSTQLFGELGEPQGVGRGLGILGVVRFRQSESRAARELLSDALTTLADCHDPWGKGQAHTYRGLAARAAGDQAAALDDLRQAMIALAPTGDATILGIALAGLAALTVAQDPHRALRLAAAAVGHRQRIGGSYPPWTLQDVKTVRDTGIRRLGEHAAQTEWQIGLRLDPADIAGVVAGAKLARTQGPLTARQLQVSSLVAHGLTNAQVADQLKLSERTVENHVSNSLTKLGLHNRIQLATWIAKHPHQERAQISER